MAVRGLLTRGGRLPVAVLEGLETGATLAFAIPTDEAHRLARALGLAPCPRAPISELVLELVTTLDATLVGAVLDGSEDGVVARITLRAGARELALPCHPADALTLAVCAEVPIHATAAALALADAAPRPDQAVEQWLHDVKPADFGDGETRRP